MNSTLRTKIICTAALVAGLAWLSCQPPDIDEGNSGNNSGSHPDAGQTDGGQADAGQADAGFTDICTGVECQANALCDPDTGLCRCLWLFVEYEGACIDSQLMRRECCSCLANRIIPGPVCLQSNEPCVEEFDACWCTSDACTAGQCGSYLEIAPNSLFGNANCGCQTDGGQEWICGYPVLIGANVEACVATLNSGGVLDVREEGLP